MELNSVELNMITFTVYNDYDLAIDPYDSRPVILKEKVVNYLMEDIEDILYGGVRIADHEFTDTRGKDWRLSKVRDVYMFMGKVVDKDFFVSLYEFLISIYF